jgi:dihydroorotate dehydrogenase electron transfer subunit
LDQFISIVKELECIADDYYLLNFKWNTDSVPKAGQFLTIRTTELTSPLLRRPFALSSYDHVNGTASIIFQKRGNGTSIMSQLRKGDTIDVLGPLGNSFSEYNTRSNNSLKKHVVVAGGIGTGPMLYLAEELKETGIDPLLIIGCRTKSLIPFTVLGKEIETIICTDDGSYGFKGTVVDYMRSVSELKSQSAIYCCGPEPMLRGCHKYALETENRCFVSLEQIMACGVGACMGCTCETEGKRKYARVCKDGPVFDSREVKWT